VPFKKRMVPQTAAAPIPGAPAPPLAERLASASPAKVTLDDSSQPIPADCVALNTEDPEMNTNTSLFLAVKGAGQSVRLAEFMTIYVREFTTVIDRVAPVDTPKIVAKAS
jgi:hypothetical protein